MNWVWANLDLIWDRTVDQLVLSVPAIILSFLIAVPIGWLANRYRVSRGILLTFCGLLYAIPSFPLLIALPLVISVELRSPENLIVALTLYGVALMVRVVADGLAAVDVDVKQSATAVGFSAWRQFWGVEFPLAGPVLLAGMRVVTVSTVSLATIGAVIGVQSLGSLFTDGFQRGIQAEVVAGLVVTVLVALLLDGALVLLGRALMPWSRRMTQGRSARVPVEESMTAGTAGAVR